MIELVSSERCTGCNICVLACPTRVFDPASSAGSLPTIARQQDCQTCFMCELYCPEDALFVAPDADAPRPVDERLVRERGLLGSYRAAIGWHDRQPTAAQDRSYLLLEKVR
jgi:NAD-dependent dihydropyrimidine dehydrogenase PreA subunit